MNKVKVKNNGKLIGTVLVDYNYFKKCISKTIQNYVYYEVKPNESLESIIIGYQTDPDKIKDLKNNILKINHITNISNGDIIRLVGVPSNHYLNLNDINIAINNIKTEYTNTKKYFEEHPSIVSETDQIILNYLDEYIKNGDFASRNSLEQFTKRLRSLESKK